MQIISRFVRSLRIIACIFLWANTASASTLQFSFSDAVGDAYLLPSQVGPVTDITSMLFTFDNATGAYSVGFTASPINPFAGNFTLNANIFNANTATYIFDTNNVFTLSAPTTSITLTGTNSLLLNWQPGDSVAACNGPTGLIPGICAAALGGPTNFSSGIYNVVPDAQNPGFYIPTAGDIFTSPSNTIGVVATVPLPASFLLLAVALGGIFVFRKREKSAPYRLGNYVFLSAYQS